MNHSPFPRADLDLSFVLRSLNPHLGALHLRGLLVSAVMWLVHRRIGEICGRLERLVARFRAGTLRRVPVRKAVVRQVMGGVVEDVTAGRVKAGHGWPRRFGWLVAMGGWKVAAVTAQLEAVLGTPDMQGLLTAAPQTRRLLLPFCRALGVPVHLLRPATFPAEKGTRERVKRVRRIQPPVDWGRVPLPRGVLGWAKRERRLDRARVALARLKPIA